MSRIIRAFNYSVEGLIAATKHETAFRQEVFLSLFLLPAACLIPVELHLRLYLVMSMLMVLIVELLNSAIEAVVDKTTPEIHPLAKKAKDYGSAAVLLTLFHLFLAWGLALFLWLL